MALSAKEKTALRNQVQARVEEAIKLIVAAATLALADDPERLAKYRALLPASKAGAKPAAKRPCSVAPRFTRGVGFGVLGWSVSTRATKPCRG